MKKIITLLFFVGFLTSAFAQSHQHDGSANSNNRGGHNNNYAYNKDHGSRGGSWRDRNNHRGYRDHDNWRHNEHRRYDRDHRRGSWFRIFHNRHWH